MEEHERFFFFFGKSKNVIQTLFLFISAETSDKVLTMHLKARGLCVRAGGWDSFSPSSPPPPGWKIVDACAVVFGELCPAGAVKIT